MKYVLVLALVLVGVWLFRFNRRNDKNLDARARERPAAPPQNALDMVRCRVCDLHLPRPDAIEGKKGVYCSLEHRQQLEP
jgi:uncharacterized protein